MISASLVLTESYLSHLLEQIVKKQSQMSVLLIDHTRGLFVQFLLAIWLIQAQIQHSRLLLIPERIVESNGLLLLKPYPFRAQNFLEMDLVPLQLKAIYMDDEKLDAVP